LKLARKIRPGIYLERSGSRNARITHFEIESTGTDFSPKTITMRFSLWIPIAVLGTLTGLAAEQTGTARRVLAADYSTKRLAIIGADNKIEWEYPIGDVHDAQLLPNGNMLLQSDWTHVIEVNPAHKIVWEYDAGKNGNAGKRIEVHSFQRLDNGRTMITESGSGRIIEVDGQGRIQHEIKLKRKHPDAHMDTRLARKIANGNYLVAQQNDGAVCEYDPNGNIVWQYEVPLFGKERKPGHGPEAFGNFVFSASRLSNGNTLIGGGNGHCVLEVTPQKEIVWKIEQNDLPGITLAWVTMTERLPNGNTVLVNCHAGPDNPQMIEVTPEKKVVWTFHDFKNFGNATAVAFILPDHK
jgi:hypothetical protein